MSEALKKEAYDDDFGAVQLENPAKGGTTALPASGLEVNPKRPFIERVEEYMCRLSTKNTFWHRLFSWIWLPFAFHSGIRMEQDGNTCTAVLPFRRFNRNWYNAMAGAVLLGNSEIAGGSFVFKYCQGNYRVVCKKLEYRFLRPCVGPAMYKMTPREDINEAMKTGKEFNVTLDISIVQVMRRPQKKERRVGKCVAVFHASKVNGPRKTSTALKLRKNRNQRP
jgi:hypothetical protein